VGVAVERLSRGHYRVTLEPLVGHDEDLAEGAMVDRYAARVEAQIRAHPSDWLWAYRRWKDRRRRPPAGSAGRGEG
jgi:KDO2-lipid IV(A) lauroyltransferase